MNDLLSEPNLYLPLTGEEFTTTTEEEADIVEKANQNPNEIFLLALEEDLVVGLLNNTANRRAATIHDTTFGITVRRQYRGQGIGRRLLESFLEWANNNPTIRSVSLTVWKSNRVAIGLYKSLGFHQCGIRKYSVHRYGRFQPVLTMEKLLRKPE